MKKCGVFVGRLCPIHMGHKKTIDTMIEENDESLIIIGSVGQKASMRVLFDYVVRKLWVQILYPTIPVVGTPDFPGDNRQWYSLVRDHVDSCFGWKSTSVTFYGGSLNDLEVFSDRGEKIKVLDRSELPVSGTVVRDMLLNGQRIDGIVDPKIQHSVETEFKRRMADPDSWEVNHV